MSQETSRFGWSARGSSAFPARLALGVVMTVPLMSRRKDKREALAYHPEKDSKETPPCSYRRDSYQPSTWRTLSSGSRLAGEKSVPSV
jgi:hypothetical protein